MRFDVARLRLVFSSLFLIPLVSAHEDILFTSSVSYCAPPENILVQQFDVAYIAHNRSVAFNVSAASIQANVNVTANLFLNVYGMHPANVTIDICSLFNNALCPLPVYNFVGAETLQLPSSVNLNSLIPGIAYKIPDLEAFAQLSLFDVNTGELKACIQATISNGWSIHQTGVSWATGGIGFLALFSAAWQSFIPDALAPFRLLDLVALYQFIASSSFLNLNYPVVYRSFTLNFSWAMGLFAQSTSSSMQNSITKMRHLTGGNMTDASGNGLALVNRKLSPYNVPAANYVVPKSLLATASALPKVNLADLSDSSYVLPIVNRSAVDLATINEVQIVTEASSNVLQAGVPIYVSAIGIATANAFMTIFLVALILTAITLALLGIVYGILLLLARSGRSRPSWLPTMKAKYPAFAGAWAIRLALVCFFPLVVFSFYQWTLKDSWLSILISVITFVIIMGAVGYPTLRVLLYCRRSSPFTLSIDLPAHEPLHGQFRPPRLFFFALPILAAFVRSLFIAFSKANGTVQIACLVVIEFLLLLSLAFLKPGKTRRADILSIFLAIVRLVCTGLSIAFLEHLNLAPIPRVVIGIIMAVILSVTVIIMFLNTIWNLGLQQLWHRRPLSLRKGSGPSTSSDDSMLEKNDDVEKKGRLLPDEKGDPSPSYHSSTFTVSRPTNPTPTHNVPLDPNVNRPYPAFTPTTTYAEPSSAQTTNSEMSYGKQIPSRLMPARSSNSYSAGESPSQYSPTPLSTSYGASTAGHGELDTPSHLSHSRHLTIEEGQVTHAM